MRKLFISIVLCFVMLVPATLAAIEYEGFHPYGFDNYAIFVPDTWTASKNESGNYVFDSGVGDDLKVFMSVSVSHPSVDREDPDDIAFVYDVFLRSMGIPNMIREDITINDMPAVLWSTVTDDDLHVHGISYITDDAMINIYYMCFTEGHEDDIDLLMDIVSKIIPIDEYYAE